MRTLVVLPTYQEAANIADVLQRIRAAAPQVEILVVDDSSPDGTADLAEAMGRELGAIRVVRRAAKTGLGSAYRHGFGIGLDEGYETLVEMDADLSHDPSALPSLLGAVEGGADLVIGSRYVPGGSIPEWPWYRRALSIWGNRYAAALLGFDVRDATSGYRAYKADVIRKINMQTIKADGYGFQIEMAYRVCLVGGTIEEIPINFTDRTLGQSKMSSRIVVEALYLVTRWAARDRLLGWRRR